jgi:hypothetical protein
MYVHNGKLWHQNPTGAIFLPSLYFQLRTEGSMAEKVGEKVGEKSFWGKVPFWEKLFGEWSFFGKSRLGKEGLGKRLRTVQSWC